MYNLITRSCLLSSTNACSGLWLIKFRLPPTEISFIRPYTATSQEQCARHRPGNPFLLYSTTDGWSACYASTALLPFPLFSYQSSKKCLLTNHSSNSWFWRSLCLWLSSISDETSQSSVLVLVFCHLFKINHLLVRVLRIRCWWCMFCWFLSSWPLCESTSELRFYFRLLACMLERYWCT